MTVSLVRHRRCHDAASSVRTPSVAVCVPLFRKEGFIAATIQSVLDQTFTDFELVILDNASPDRSAEIARSFDDPRLVVAENPSTLGPIDNFNRVVSLSTAPLVKVLCADDLLHPTCLERQVAVMEQDAALAMVSCRQDMIDENGTRLAHDRGLRKPDLVGTQNRSTVVRRLVRHGGNPIGNVNNVLFRRSAFDAAGGFPGDANFFALDVAMWVRLLEHGTFHGIPETLTSFRLNSGSHSSDLGGEAIRIQRTFVDGLRHDNPGIVRRRDTVFGALRAPLTRARHHMLFAAAGPAGSPLRTVSEAVLKLGGRSTGQPSEHSPGIAVLETEPLGHRLHYLAHLVGAAAPGSCTVLTTAHAMQSEDYRVVSDAIAGAAVALPDAASPAAALTSAVAVARAGGARLLVVPEGDPYLPQLLKLLLRRPRLRLGIRLLLLRTTTVGGPERLRPATVVKPVLVQLLRLFPQVQILFLTDALGVVEHRRGYAGLQAVKDPVLRPGAEIPDRPAWLPAPEPDRTLVGVFGVVSARKNLPVLVRAVVRLPEVVLVVGGRLEPEVRAFVDTDEDVRTLLGEGRLVVVDRLLDAGELHAALAGVDLVSVLHDNDSPSGILAEACVRGTPSIVPTGGWLAEVVGTSGTGVAVPLTAAGVAAGVRRLRADADVHAEAIRRHAPRIGTTDFTDRLLGV